MGGHTKAVVALDIDHSGARVVTGGLDYKVRGVIEGRCGEKGRQVGKHGRRQRRWREEQYSLCKRLKELSSPLLLHTSASPLPLHTLLTAGPPV
jgi:hypothetical protein